MKKVNITDVAKLAKVSVSTVSLVLRQKGQISEATTEKVHAAISELGYVHNVAAANLRSNTSNLIGLIIDDFNDTFSIKVMTSLVRNLELQGYMVFLCQPMNDELKLRHCLKSFLQQGVAGVVYISNETLSRNVPAPVSESHLPIVIVSRSGIEGEYDIIEYDNREAGNSLTRYLIEHGHRNIAYLGGNKKCLIRQARLQGYHYALEQYGLLFREEWVPECEESTFAASAAVCELLKRYNNITAILCHSPSAIIGCINGAHRLGRTVGKDIFVSQQISVAGFEDMMHINLTSPSLTFVSLSSEETGYEAASLIIKKIKDPAQAVQRIIISSQLILRESA